MKFFKMMSWLIAIVIAIALAAAIYVFLNLNSVVQRAVEEVGTKLVQTDVSLASVDISPIKGRGELRGFSIANPAGFNSPHAIDFQEFVLHIDPASLQQEVLVIKEISISGINLSVEQAGNTTNIQALKNNLDKFIPESSGQQEAPESSVQKRFMVETLKFSEGSVNLITEKYGEKSYSLPAFKQNNIGDKTNGLTAEQLGKKLLDIVTSNAKKATEKELKKLLSDELKQKAKDKAGEKVENELRKLKGLLKK